MLCLNHQSSNDPAEKKLCIWIFHDARPGHLNQLKGLVNRMLAHEKCECHWFNVAQHKLKLRNLFYLPGFYKPYPKPDMILGAGHQTHTSILIAGFIYKAFTSVIMKPSLPHKLFNAVLCPRHDGLADSPRVLSTFGPINNIVKNNTSTARQERPLNLILLGGLSKHYHFDSAAITQQVKDICTQDPNVEWILSNSPRTPESINSALHLLELPNLSLQDYRDKDATLLQEALPKARFTWVTPDSMSMVFEALTGGGQVGLFQCKPKRANRITTQIEKLVDDGYVCEHNTQSSLPTQTQNIPWEADRAAQWLLHTFKGHQKS
jgi:uncharacterized protein